MASIIKVDQLSEKTQGSGITLSHSLKNSSGSEIISSSGLIESPTFVGMIASFAMSTAPTGWLVCNGAQYAITDYGDLYTAIGTTWGSLTDVNGDPGSTHFRVPDLQGAFLRGIGTGTFDGRSKVGPSNVGDFDEDEFQGHYHNGAYVNAFGDKQAPGYLAVISTHNQYHTGAGQGRGNLPSDTIRFPTNDGTNGTPRTGNETRPFHAGIQYCIKY